MIVGKVRAIQYLPDDDSRGRLDVVIRGQQFGVPVIGWDNVSEAMELLRQDIAKAGLSFKDAVPCPMHEWCCSPAGWVAEKLKALQ